MPTSMIAAISSEVATGRRINSRDGLTPYSYPACARQASPTAAPGFLSLTLAAALTLAVGLTGWLARLLGGRLPRRLVLLLARLRRRRLAAAVGDRDLSAFLEPVRAIGDDNLPRLQA